MKKGFSIVWLLLVQITVLAQYDFKTVVSRQPVVVGESFQVQYILENADKATSVRPPAFNNFRFVTGPYRHNGTLNTVDGPRSIQNDVYTLEAIKPGKFQVNGATTSLNGKMLRSNDVWVEILSKSEAVKRFDQENGINASGYFLRPGEDPYEKIKQNLFIKMMVDKRNCYVGEPVLATFKLYSRLESKSDIVKNPGFYGFTVHDMVNLGDKQVNTETVNGRVFDVHTIRKVQLYPLQAGEYIIDPIQVRNRVEFSRSVVNKKTEQEIAEGMLGNHESAPPANEATVYESEIVTEPVTILVKSTPEKSKPNNYSGAVGQFLISAKVISSTLKKNEEGFFDVAVTGKGNFTQLSAPAVLWPAGVEGFEPIVKDELDKSSLPLKGTRTFRYSFICSAPGQWQLPAVTFSFYDTDSNQYKTISTEVVQVISTNQSKKNIAVIGQKPNIASTSEKAARTAGIVVVSIVLIILLYWALKKKEPEKIILAETPSKPRVKELLAPAYEAIEMQNPNFYSILNGIIWNFLTDRFDFSGYLVNKNLMSVKLIEAGVSEQTLSDLFSVMQHCETGAFTGASLEINKVSLVTKAKSSLEKINGEIEDKEVK